MSEFKIISPVEMARLMYEEGKTLEFENGKTACWDKNDGRFILFGPTLTRYQMGYAWSHPCRIKRREFPFKKHDKVLVRHFPGPWEASLFKYINKSKSRPYITSHGVANAYIAKFDESKVDTLPDIEGQWGPEDVK